MTLLDDEPTTPPPIPPGGELSNPDRPQPKRRIAQSDLIDIGAAALGSAALAGMLRIVLGWHGFMSTAVWWYLLFLLAYFVLQRDGESRETGIDRVITFVIWSVGAAVVAVLGWMLVFLALKGYHKLTPGFFSHDMSRTGPLNPGGGAEAAIIGSVEQVGMATAIVVPLALLTAIYLNELKGRLAVPIRLVVDSLAGLPSIVAGLIVYTVWVTDGHGFSGAAGSASLAILMLPYVTRATEETLRTIPDSLREASLALGAPQWRVVLLVVLPTALTGITTAVILGIAQAVGETAPLLLTTSYSSAVNTNPFHGAQASLPYFVYTYVLEPNKAQNARGFTAALILVLLVLGLFLGARWVAGRSQRKLRRSS
jgi:phosphate transport system permease protein